MGRKSTERIKRITNEVLENDIKNGRIKPPTPKPRKVVKPKERPVCCIDRHPDLPVGFRPCIDCPKGKQDD